jgi:hypothetical protein
MGPKDGALIEEISAFLVAAQELAEREANEHYAALYSAFVEAVPLFFQRTGENTPARTRPKAFNADAKAYTFYLNMPPDHAITAAIFTFKKKPALWRLKHYVSLMALSPFQCEQVASKSIGAALLTAREMWLAHEARQAQAPPIDTGSVMVN